MFRFIRLQTITTQVFTPHSRNKPGSYRTEHNSILSKTLQ